ncbi:MAG: thioredoxin family protein [Actinobacteria bacterium]|nr:thioredoxin family protein [Actinomycetota bacterium]
MARLTMDRSITLRYFDGCPNWQVARTRLEQALERINGAAEIMLEQVETAEEAQRVGFQGSPTILIDGVDPFAGADASPGLSCRVYRTEKGMEGAPSVSQLLAALGASES